MDILNDWPNSKKFEAEKEFIAIIKGETVIKPVKMKYDDTKEYQICISFLLDAFQQLPYNPEIALERILLALDCYSPNEKLINIYDNAVNILDNNIERNKLLEEVFDRFCSSLPVKTQALLVSRLYRNYDYLESVESQKYLPTKQLWTRLSKVNGNENCEKKNVYDLLRNIGNKYKLFDFTKQEDNEKIKEYDGTKRKMGRLIALCLKEDIEINSKKYTLSRKDKLYLLIQGLLQTIRNDRMHGNFTL